MARFAGVPIATDVHGISNLEDAYNRDIMAVADILFMSAAHIPAAPEAWIRAVLERYGNPMIVLGMGERGALLSVKDDRRIEHFPAITTRPVVNTIGAGLLFLLRIKSARLARRMDF